MSRGFLFSLILMTGLAVTLPLNGVGGSHPSFSSKAKIDTLAFYPGGTYDAAVAVPDDYISYPLGEWPLRYHQLVPYLHALAESSDRVVVEPYGRTHEGRQLYNVFISAPEHIANREAIREKTRKLGSPQASLSSVALDSLVADLPATAWVGYSIHGDELSGVDAAMLLAYQLAAGTDSATWRILRNVLIIIDPIQNPDGRERYLSMLETYRSHVPNYDRNAMQHNGIWPWGRTNHYLFDMNRDWILLTQPETEGRVSTIVKWHPQLVIDAHEMGSNATYLFSPAREPINENTPSQILKWWDVFAADQAAAYDARGWPYYTKEWHEQWYPGYGSAWPSFSGAIGVLYEQAGVDGSVVRQRDGYLLSYHEAVNHQFTSSWTNLTTLVSNREPLLRDYRTMREEAVHRGRRSRLKFLIVPDSDLVKTKKFIERLVQQGIEVHRAQQTFTVGSADDYYGETHSSKRFPAGTYIVHTEQPVGALAKTLLEFDAHMKYEVLEEERREKEKHNKTKMYEVTAWCLPMGYDIEAYATQSAFNVASERIEEVSLPSGALINPSAQFGFLVNMEGELTYRLLHRLFSEELVVYTATKGLTCEGRDYLPGALLLRKRGNPDTLADILGSLAEEVGITIYGVNTGFSTEGSHLGAPTFRVLAEPRVALLTGDPLDYTSFGSLWFTIDRELKLPHSLIKLSEWYRRSLEPYNVVVLPGAWGQLRALLGKQGAQKLSEWVEDGGTLICIRRSAAWAADTSVGLSQVQLKRQVLDKLDDYHLGLKREIQAEAPGVDTMALWHPDKVPPEEADQKEKEKAASKEDLERLDEWQRRFYPQGVFMKAGVDTEHWLAFGMRERLPVLTSTRDAFMADRPVRTVVRYADEKDLRLSGLLWPEGRQRWANTAVVTHERKGRGQIIMFGAEPTFRAYTWGIRRLFVNAVLYGPGMLNPEEPYGNGHQNQ